MSNLDEARRLLDKSPGHPVPESRVRMSIAHALLSIAESLEKLTLPVKIEQVLKGERMICHCGGNPTYGRCDACGCVPATEFFSRVVCLTHQLDSGL